MKFAPKLRHRPRKVDPLSVHQAPGPHNITVSSKDQDAPGVFEVRCSCYGTDTVTGIEYGYLSWAPFGEEMAVEMAENHLALAGEKGARVFGWTPSGPRREKTVKFDRGGVK